jgi:signal transduction histidine kinase
VKFAFILALLLMPAVCRCAEQLSIAEVNRILTTPSETAERKATLRGVISFVAAAPAYRAAAIQQDGVGVMARFPASVPIPGLGDEVEVDATIKFVSDNPNTTITVEAARVVGHPGPPAPVRCSLDDVVSGRMNRRTVEVEAVVLQAVYQSDLWLLQLADAETWSNARIYSAPANWSPRDWFGARVRFRGFAAGRGPLALRCSSPEEITILSPGSASAYSGEEKTAAALRAAGASSGTRVKMKAIVTGLLGDQIYLRNAEMPLRAAVLYPVEGVDPKLPRALAPVVPKMNVGDQVEVVGSPQVVGADVRLRHASFRVLGPGEAPVPVPVEATALADGSAANEFVRVGGRLLERAQAEGSGAFLETLHISSQKGPVKAVFESRRGGFLQSLKPDDLVELTGFVTATGTSPAFNLRLANAADARSLGVDPAVPRQRLIRVIAVGSAAVLGVLFWAWFLRRKVSARTAALAVVNARLTAEIEERKKAQADVDRALSAERELGELKTRFVSLVSHEFRTPLGITMSAVELLRHYGERLAPAKLNELHNDIHDATLRMSGLMEQVLVLGRVEAGKQPLHSAPLDLTGLGEKLVDEMRSATNARCRLNFRAENDVSGACADEGLLRHILSNLLSNAAKYSSPGSEVDLTVRREGADAVFTIRDHGIGIPVADQARLFEAFHRATNVGETPGTGLGLLIVKRCVDMHGGRVWFDSREGEGTTFFARLPVFADPTK